MEASVPYDSAQAAQMSMGSMVVSIIFIILMIASIWKIFSKSGQPGWGALIPFYNIYLMLKVAGKPGWWLLLMFIPFVNFVIMIIMYHGVSKNFGHGGGFTVGMVLLPIIFFPVLAFSSAAYAPVAPAA